jgi:hypothetical protein
VCFDSSIESATGTMQFVPPVGLGSIAAFANITGDLTPASRSFHAR